MERSQWKIIDSMTVDEMDSMKWLSTKISLVEICSGKYHLSRRALNCAVDEITVDEMTVNESELMKMQSMKLIDDKI